MWHQDTEIRFFFLFLAFLLSTVPVLLLQSAAGLHQSEIIARSDEKLASKRCDSPGMAFYCLKGFSHGSKPYPTQSKTII